MFAPTSKKLLLTGLAACFVVQSGLVYTDDVDLVLSEEAVAGRKLFHEKSCQVCHQLWGQGGFLGPDLTNAASRVDEARLASLLTVGSGQMPAFGMSETEIGQVRAFLEELDRSGIGRGQLRLGDPEGGASPQAAFESAVREAGAPEDAARGFEAFAAGICSTCHYPFRQSPVLAPDLSRVVETTDEATLREVLTNGRLEKGMPPPTPAFDEETREDVLAYLRWLNENRADLVAASARLRSGGPPDWSKLSWWEYR